MTHQQAVDKQAAERYLLDEMPELERFAFEEHLFGCEICADDVRTGALMQEGVKAGLLPEAASGSGLQASGEAQQATGSSVPRTVNLEPRTLAREPRTLNRFVPWAVAATVALAAGYQTLVVVPGLRTQALEPSVLAPVTLRGASRGAAPSLTRPTTGALSFAVDLPGIPAGARLAYDLRAADGRSVAAGTAAAPPPGTPLLLLIPASALETAGTYVVSVSAGEGSVAVDYAFTITNP